MGSSLRDERELPPRKFKLGELRALAATLTREIYGSADVQVGVSRVDQLSDGTLANQNSYDFGVLGTVFILGGKATTRKISIWWSIKSRDIDLLLDISGYRRHVTDVSVTSDDAVKMFKVLAMVEEFWGTPDDLNNELEDEAPPPPTNRDAAPARASHPAIVIEDRIPAVRESGAPASEAMAAIAAEHVRGRWLIVATIIGAVITAVGTIAAAYFRSR